jgi:tetratricopeptide (TPR) repeat protein
MGLRSVRLLVARGYLFKFLSSSWLLVVLALAVSLAGSALFELVDTGKLRLAPAAIAFLAADGIWIVIILLFFAVVTLWARHSWYLSQAKAQFVLLTSAAALRPEDFAFQVVAPGEKAHPGDRPFVADAYIQRRAVPYDRMGDKDPEPTYSEEDLVRSLMEGRSLLLVGQPSEGKSRTLYGLVKQLGGYWIVKPAKGALPSQDGLRLLRGRDCILLVDDLSDYVGRIDLADLHRSVSAYARTCTVAATCRDGPEFTTVKTALDDGMRRFFEEIPLKLGLVGITVEQKAQLAAAVGDDSWTSAGSDLFPTPGTIAMASALESMRARFRAIPPEHKDLLRAVRLLDVGGVLPYTQSRVKTIWESVFQRVGSHLGDCVDRLADESFLRRPARQNPVQPEPAYLKFATTYTEGRQPEDDFSALADALFESGDGAGLYYLARSLWASRSPLAESVADKAVAAGVPQASQIIGWILMGNPERHGDAETCFRDLVKQGFYTAYNDLGNSLKEQPGREVEAEDAYRAAVEKGVPVANFGLAQMLEAKGQRKEAEAAFKEAIKSGYHAIASVALIRLLANDPDRWGEIEKISKEAIGVSTRTKYPPDLLAGPAFAWLALGLSQQAARKTEAEEALRNAIRCKSAATVVEVGKLMAEKGQSDLAELAFREAAKAGDASAYYRLGLLLEAQDGRQQAAMQAYRDGMAAGDLDNCRSLAGILLKTPDGAQEAEQVARRAVAAGIEEANFELGLALTQQLGNASDVEEAFRLAAQAGVPAAHLLLGMVIAEDPTRREEARLCFQQAKASGVHQVDEELARLDS